MEEDLSRELYQETVPGLDRSVDRAFSLREQDWSGYAPLTLAFLGDSVFDMVVRTVLVKRHRMQARKLHQRASEIVNARTQAKMAQILEPYFSDEEAAVYRRGRNASPDHNAKNASRREYLEATGLEALVGYLYLERRYDRAVELIRTGIDACELLSPH